MNATALLSTSYPTIPWPPEAQETARPDFLDLPTGIWIPMTVGDDVHYQFVPYGTLASQAYKQESQIKAGVVGGAVGASVGAVGGGQAGSTLGGPASVAAGGSMECGQTIGAAPSASESVSDAAAACGESDANGTAGEAEGVGGCASDGESNGIGGDNDGW